jgi:hypothetical protein
LPPNVADVEVRVTWHGAQRRQAQLKALYEVTPQRRLTQLGSLPRAAWTPANGVFDALTVQMHEADTAFFASSQRTSAERALIEWRRAISASTGREQCALFAARVYTDGSFVVIAGTDRAVCWVRIWGEFARRSRSRMAKPRKRLAGAGGIWCGVANIPCIGVAHTECAKTVRAYAVRSHARRRP